MKLFSKKTMLVLMSALFLASCGGTEVKEEKQEPTRESFLTLADVAGKTSFKEESPDERVINIKEKAFIKLNDIVAAKQQALSKASVVAVDAMVRELLSAEVYNRNYAKVEEYMKKNVDKYILASDVNAEKKIYAGAYYGISASFKVSRQKTLVALQKDLKLINTSGSSIVVVVTNKKDIDLSPLNFTLDDIENTLMKQLQTDLNQRGLRAMDFRNAIVSMQTDETKKASFGKISKAQFMATITGSKPADAALNEQVASAEEFYSTGLSLLKQIAKVVVEVNIFAISGNINGDLSMSLNVSANNISTGTGGAFANTIVNLARRGGPNVIPSAMVTGLMQDTVQEMGGEFIPQVIKEMSSVRVGGKKLVAYELVFKDFAKKDGRKLRKLVQGLESNDLRYIDSSNAVPTILSVFVRYTGRGSDLGDRIMDQLDGQFSAEEPITAPDLTDIVFVKEEEESDD